MKCHYFALFLLLACGCSKPDNAVFRAKEKSPTAIVPTTQFELLAPERTGITFVPTITDDYVYNFLRDPYIYNGGGVAVIDMDNDGLQDLFFTARLQGCRLYRNLGGLKFEDISEKSGVSKLGGLKTGVTVVDINADGWMDMYVCRTWLEPLPERRNIVFINNRNGTFTDMAQAYGLDDISASQQANFFDYDLDGDLDCYLMNHPVDFKSINNLDFVPTPANPFARKQQPKNEYESDRLYRNDVATSQQFTDVTAQAGLTNRAFGLSVISTDFNRDGYQDLYVGNDFIMPDFAYINNKNGTFTDKAAEMFRHTSNHSMGTDIADLNNDGLLDLVTLDMLAQPWARRKSLMSSMILERDRKMQQLGYGKQTMRNTLQLNNGTTEPTYSEIGCLAGIEATDWSWAPLIADYDNDGWKDLFISNGIKRDLNDLDFFLYVADSINHAGGVSKKNFANFEDYARLMPSVAVHNFCYQNTGSLQMTDVSEAWGFQKATFSNGAAYADLDNDGDLDLITNNMETPAGIYENKATGFNQNNWLQIKLKGTAQNPMGLGAWVQVFAGGKPLFFQEMANVRGYYSSVEPIWQVGLGKNDVAERIEIQWPNGKFQILENVKSNQRVVVDIANAKAGKLPPPSNAPTLLNENGPSFKTLTDYAHIENAFEDFDRERLLPYRLSTLGPCLAVADLNGDGREDLFVGGATDQAGTVFLQNSTSGFAKTNQPALENDRQQEDVASLFFDADGDNDPDLYVVSGGNEANANDAKYQDRLYLNDGKGLFSRAKDALPTESSSGACVRAHDFDRDGDLDLFVGGRCVPGRFPETPQSFVFKNDKGKFSDVTTALAPSFQAIGMVTDLQLVDLNGDKQAELVAVGDWMPLKIFELQNGQYQDVSEKYGAQTTNGWWNCLTAVDIDGDGDQDLVAGNQGLNTRLHVETGEAPLKLFAKDFDGNGSIDPIITVPEDGQYRPLAIRDQLAMQMLALVKKKFPRYAPYAKASIADLFVEKDLLAAQTLETHTLATTWFENANGKLTAHALPLEAQFAPTMRVLATDINQDGHMDLLTVGNDAAADVETYLLDASNGCVLLGNGKGGFEAMPGRKSGLWANKQARDAALVKLSNGKRAVIVANNNDCLQVFQVN